MPIYVILFWSLLIHTCSSQLKACYQATDGQLAGDFPCNPDANVSSCCASGNICSSNLYCISAANQQKYVGTCTDKTWSNPACPFNLTSGGKFNGWYDKFNYQLNTTQCPDGTLCPSASNKPCCDAHKGIREVHYKYNSSAVMPANEEQLTTFYAAAGYTFPTSIPPTSSSRASSTPGSAQSTTAASGLKPGAKAGISIGITLSVVLCTVCVLLLHMRRRRRYRQQQRLEEQQQQQTQEQPQHQEQQNRRYTPKELASSLIALTRSYSKELEGTPVGSELEGSQYTQKQHEEKA